jgi:hypothetical protein
MSFRGLASWIGNVHVVPDCFNLEFYIGKLNFIVILRSYCFKLFSLFLMKCLMMCMLQELQVIWYFIICMLCKFECGKQFSLSFAVQHCMFFWKRFYMFVWFEITGFIFFGFFPANFRSNFLMFILKLLISTLNVCVDVFKCLCVDWNCNIVLIRYFSLRTFEVIVVSVCWLFGFFSSTFLWNWYGSACLVLFWDFNYFNEFLGWFCSFLKWSMFP